LAGGERTANAAAQKTAQSTGVRGDVTIDGRWTRIPLARRPSAPLPLLASDDASCECGTSMRIEVLTLDE
jgi:hypothetical protein